MRIQRKLIYLAHPRTGSTATQAALAKRGGVKSVSHHQRFREYKDLLGERVITTIRHPVDMMLSWFHLNPSWHVWKDFCAKYKHSELEEDGRLFYHAEHCDTLLYYPRLEDELNRVLQEVGLKEVRMLRINVTAGKKKIVDPEADAILRERWPRDFEVWDAVSERADSRYKGS